MANVNYTLRVDETDKKKAEQVFKTLGMTLSTGINIYLKAVGRQQRIPFSLAVNDTVPAASLSDVFKSLQEESVQNGVSEMTLDEINAEIATYRREKRGM